MQRTCIDDRLCSLVGTQHHQKIAHHSRLALLVQLDDPVVGPIMQQAPFPRLIGEATPVPTGAPMLGAHTDEVLGSLLGLSADELADLRARSVI